MIISAALVAFQVVIAISSRQRWPLLIAAFVISMEMASHTRCYAALIRHQVSKIRKGRSGE